MVVRRSRGLPITAHEELLQTLCGGVTSVLRRRGVEARETRMSRPKSRQFRIAVHTLDNCNGVLGEIVILALMRVGSWSITLAPIAAPICFGCLESMIGPAEGRNQAHVSCDRCYSWCYGTTESICFECATEQLAERAHEEPKVLTGSGDSSETNGLSFLGPPSVHHLSKDIVARPNTRMNTPHHSPN